MKFVVCVCGGISNFRCTCESKMINFPRLGTKSKLLIAFHIQLHILGLWRETVRLACYLRRLVLLRAYGHSCFGAIGNRSFNHPDLRVSISVVACARFFYKKETCTSVMLRYQTCINSIWSIGTTTVSICFESRILRFPFPLFCRQFLEFFSCNMPSLF